jgi:phospholipid-binding lipoprotein MlaA
MSGMNGNKAAKVHSGIALLLVLLMVGGCATVKGPTDPRDPLERYNRAVFKFNDAVDRAVLKPVAKAYRRYTPRAFNLAITNFFGNLGDVGVTINDLLQFKVVDAASDVGRIVINTTLGFGGLFDIASRFGLNKHEEDFGQTLGWWGVPPGPFLMLPFFGPSTVRDTPTRAVDNYLDPVIYVGNSPALVGLEGSRLIDYRAGLLGTEETLTQFTTDRYITLRNAYLDHREFLVHDGDPPPDQELIKQLEQLEED